MEELDNNEPERIRYLTSLVELLREQEDYVTLSHIFHNLGNTELRDKYIDKALANNAANWAIVALRSLQGRIDLIPEGAVDEVLSKEEKAGLWADRARTLYGLNRYHEAAHDYVRIVLKSLDDENYFTAAYYLKELGSRKLIEKLFEKALEDAAVEGDLWWQYRALDELGWKSELKHFLIQNTQAIRDAGNSLLFSALLEVEGKSEEARKYRLKYFAKDPGEDP
ncbi:hypothetical protein [Microbispora rosea]|uniref:hypothetical protein n=1 Tax=Microbispora rosea TaxID=58117 RepID=UPI003D8A4921